MDRNMALDELYEGDCLNLLSSLPDKCADLVVTDPPYELMGGISKNPSEITACIKRYCVSNLSEISTGFDYEAVLGELCRVMKAVNIYLWCSKSQIHRYLDFFEDYGRRAGKEIFQEFLAWNKTNPIPATNNSWIQDAEWCLFFRERGVRLYGDYESKRHIMVGTVNDMQKVRAEFPHPTIKPLRFIRNFIANSSKEGDVVLDPFLGSGTTAIAALSMKRHWLGSELDPEYCDIIRRRLDKFYERNEYSGLFGI